MSINDDALKIHRYLWKMLGFPPRLKTPEAEHAGVLAGTRLINVGYDTRVGGIIRFVVQDDFWGTKVPSVNKLADFLLEPRNPDDCLETRYEAWVREGGPSWCSHKKPKESCIVCVPAPSRESCGYKHCHGGRVTVPYPYDMEDPHGFQYRLEVACPGCHADQFKLEVESYPDMNAAQKKFILEKYKPEVL
jgi:hypothetical protein